MTVLRIAIIAVLFLIHAAVQAQFVPSHIHDAYRVRASVDHWLAGLLMLAIPVVGMLEGAPWSELAFISGTLFFGAGELLVVKSMQENPHFRPEIVTPPRKVDTGVYRWLSHPGYLGMIGQASGLVLITNSRWAVWPLAGYALLLLVRSVKESKLLRAL